MALIGWARALRLLDGAEARTEVERSLARVLELAEHRALRSYAPFARLERAELARLLADESTRERELRRAAQEFQQIGAPRRAAEAEAALGA